MTRYAVYFAPAVESEWWTWGSNWLGRDAISNKIFMPADQYGLSTQIWDEITRVPRSYGFHATLKAPFRLIEKYAESELMEKIGELANSLKGFSIGKLELSQIGEFIALTPGSSYWKKLSKFAAKCVIDLDVYRAPLSREDLVRRQFHMLDQREQDLLMTWGYHLVMERFMFHMSLTGPIKNEIRCSVVQALKHKIDELNEKEALRLDRICLFTQTEPGQSFIRKQDWRVG